MTSTKEAYHAPGKFGLLGRSFAERPLQNAPDVQPDSQGITDSCILCLPETACYIFGVKPNINDKGHDKRLWFGRVWQLRALQLKQYRDLVLSKHESLVDLTEEAIAKLDASFQDPKKQQLILKMQAIWRGAVTRSRARLPCLESLAFEPSSHAGIVVFMHGSGGMTYNNVRYARKLAGMGYLVIAPDSMAGGEYRKRDLAKPIAIDQETPYWDDLGLYASASTGEYTYSTDAQAVVDNPTKWRELYENVYRMRRAELHWIIVHLPDYIKTKGIFTMGQSEGAMTVARFDDQRYGATIRGRIISAFSVEYCYFTPTPEAALFGGNPDVPTLNIIGDTDQYFGNVDSVAKRVSEMKDKGGYGADVITGNAFETMKKQNIRYGLVAVLVGAKHDPSETHDNLLRDLLPAFLTAPGECHKIPALWKSNVYLNSKIKVLQEDGEISQRVLMQVGTMDYPATLPYYLEMLCRQGHLGFSLKTISDSLQAANEENDAISQKANVQVEELFKKLGDSLAESVGTTFAKSEKAATPTTDVPTAPKGLLPTPTTDVPVEQPAAPQGPSVKSTGGGSSSTICAIL